MNGVGVASRVACLRGSRLIVLCAFALWQLACQARTASSRQDGRVAPPLGTTPPPDSRALVDAHSPPALPWTAADARAAPTPDAQRATLPREHQLRAVPAWDAVIDRAFFLARRKQQGALVGIWGESESSGSPAASAGQGLPSSIRRYWLHDESDEVGALRVQVRPPSSAPLPSSGQRVVVVGAWVLEGTQWIWRAASLELLSDGDARPTAIQNESARTGNGGLPGLPIAISAAPPGTRQVSFARGEDVIYFQVVGVPRRPGDAWKVANELGDEPVALLFLPGERRSYGGLDMRTPDERWNLRRGVTYWIKIGVMTRGKPGEPWTAFAKSAPVRDL